MSRAATSELLRQQLHDQVMEALAVISDPCSVRNRTPLTLTEMNLVEEVSVTDHGHVSIKLLLTDPGCVFFFDIARAIEEKLEVVPGITSVKVETIGDRWWEPERMEPDVRARLKDMRAQRDTRHLRQ
jgi:metal-sulfur cluster biosynthetic enzyme